MRGKCKRMINVCMREMGEFEEDYKEGLMCVFLGGDEGE